MGVGVEERLKREDIYIYIHTHTHMLDSRCCIAENNTTL